jgi:hypothetical protein
MQNKLVYLVFTCLLITSCSGGTSSRVNAPSTPTDRFSPPLTSLCPDGSVVNISVGQTCPPPGQQPILLN